MIDVGESGWKPWLNNAVRRHRDFVTIVSQCIGEIYQSSSSFPLSLALSSLFREILRTFDGNGRYRNLIDQNSAISSRASDEFNCPHESDSSVYRERQCIEYRYILTNYTRYIRTSSLKSISKRRMIIPNIIQLLLRILQPIIPFPPFPLPILPLQPKIIPTTRQKANKHQRQSRSIRSRKWRIRINRRRYNPRNIAETNCPCGGNGTFVMAPLVILGPR
jgi:hypothetical protein